MRRLHELLIDGVSRLPAGRGRGLRLGAVWVDVAGPELAARAHARFAGERVVIEVEDGRWAEQIRALATDLRERLERLLGPIAGVDVVVVARRARSRPPRASEPGPSLPLPLPPAVRDRLTCIADPDLRARVGTLAAAYLMRRQRSR